MLESKIPFARGLWVSKATVAPEGFASELINFIPTMQGLKLRKGNKKIAVENINYVASYVGSKRLVLFSVVDGISVMNETENIEKVLPDNKKIPIFTLETHNRLLLFYGNQTPEELYYDGNKWSIQTLTFSSPEGQPAIETDFIGAISYRSRIYYYRKDSNILYYTSAGAYKGELQQFDVSGIFDAKGTVIFVSLLGYEGGKGAVSNLIVGFDSGDILAFDGQSPQDQNSWAAVGKISLGGSLYSSTINVGTNLYALSNEGLIDIGTALSKNDITEAKAITQPLKEENLDYSAMKIYRFGSYVITCIPTLANDFLYNIEVQGFCRLDGLDISSAAEIYSKFYFCNNKGELFQAFTSINDNGIPIKGRYVTRWVDLGTGNNKRSNFVSLSLLERGGTYSIDCNVSANFRVDNLNKARLPKQIGIKTTWREITPNWSNTRKLWLGSRINAYQTIKFPRGALGRSLAISFSIIGNEVQEFILGDSSLYYDILAF